MKVGTDGVLLGAWAAVEASDRRILDIGTGTGLIALMLAQRAPDARITALDIDPACAEQARANADASPWGGRIDVLQGAVQSFHPGLTFDLIVSNPPYYDASLLPADPGRAVARHDTRLGFDDLAAAAVRLLAPGGRFAVVLPAAEAARFLLRASQALWLIRRTDVRTTPRRGIRRALMEFSLHQPLMAPQRTELVIGDGGGGFTQQYRELTQDFYLKF